MTDKPLNILEEPIESLQFRDWPGTEVVAVYPTFSGEVLVVVKSGVSAHEAFIYQSSGRKFLACTDSVDIIRKKRSVADWMIFDYYNVNKGGIYIRKNAIPDPINPHEKSFKIPGTEREV